MSVLDDIAGEITPEPTEQPSTLDSIADEAERTFLEKAGGVLDVGLHMASGTFAVPASGIAGAGALAATQDIDTAVETQETVQDFMTLGPVSDVGREYLQTVAKVLEPVATMLTNAQKAAGESSFELGGGEDQASAVLGAAVEAAPAGVAAAIPGLREATRAIRPKGTVASDVRAERPERLAERVEPDLDVVQAAERLDIDLEPGTVSTDKSFVELTQALKAKPGNTLAVAELEAIEQLGDRARTLVNQDRTAFSDAVRAEHDTTITALQNRSNELYDAAAIDRTRLVEVDNSQAMLVDVLDEVGKNTQLMTKPERDLMKLVDSGEVTYGALDRIRRDIGSGYNRIGPYENVAKRDLDRVYAAISKDQLRVADELGLGDQLRLANSLVQERKAVEAKNLELFGKTLDQTLVAKLSRARAQLNKGDLTEFKKLMAALPEAQRRDGAALVVDALMGDNRGRFSLGQMAGVNDMLKRNPQLKREILRHFTPEERQRFDDIGTVATAIQRTKSRENTSGTGKTILAQLEDPGVIRRLYQGGRDVVAAEGVGSAAGVPGAGTLGVIASRRLGAKKSAADTATDLLTSERFRAALRRIAEGRADQANRIIEGSKSYRAWAKEHPVAARQIKTVGFVAWLTGETQRAGGRQSNGPDGLE